MIYNFNLGIGWASSGVEYAQAYRRNIFERIGKEAKFIFTDFISAENIEHYTKNIGFKDEQIIWLYTFFTDTKIAPTTYTLNDFKNTLPNNDYTYERNGKRGIIKFNNGDFDTLYFVNDKDNYLFAVEIVSRGYLIRKDYFSYTKIFSEYYAPKDNKAHMYLRRFFNENGTAAYDEINDDGEVMYKFKDHIFYNKQQLVGYMVSQLHLTKDDVMIVDRTTEVGQAILQNVNDARVGIVIHADHYSEGNTDDDYILWNNYYEYDFAMNKHIDFYVAATDAQNELVRQQFKKYMGVEPNVYTIPVGSIDELKYPNKERKPFSILTASRLANEKHIDWIVEAVARAKKQIPELSLDIYGKGGEESKILETIKKNNAQDYIKLCGHQNMTEIYKNYELYLSGSMSEGFGLTLLEAIGSGLPIIGFNVRYGNPTFIDDGKNGYLIDVDDKMNQEAKIVELTDRIIKLFTEADLDSFHNHSYEKAKKFLTSEVEKRWEEAVK